MSWVSWAEKYPRVAASEFPELPEAPKNPASSDEAVMRAYYKEKNDWFEIAAKYRELIERQRKAVVALCLDRMLADGKVIIDLHPSDQITYILGQKFLESPIEGAISIPEFKL